MGCEDFGPDFFCLRFDKESGNVLIWGKIREVKIYPVLYGKKSSPPFLLKKSLHPFSLFEKIFASLFFPKKTLKLFSFPSKTSVKYIKKQ